MYSCPKMRRGVLLTLPCCLALVWTATSSAQPRYPLPGNAQPGNAQPGNAQPGNLRAGNAGRGGGLLVAPDLQPDSAQSRHRGATVVDVRIQGNRTLPSHKFFQHITTRPSRPFDPERLQQDVLRLYRENLVSGVRTLTQTVPQGLVVIFEVVERPTIQYVKFVGNRYYSDKQLSKQANLKRGDALNPYSVTDAKRRLEEFYHEKGRIKTTVSVFEGDKLKDRGVVFYVTEGTKEQIGSVKFVGNTPSIVTDSRLKTQVKSKPGFVWFFGGNVNRKTIDEDVDRLTAYYRSLGFFKARVGREIEYTGNGRWLSLTFVIDEGPRYRIREVTVEGNTRFATNDILSRLNLKSNEYFNLAKMNADRRTLSDLYGSQGFVYANITPDPRFLEEPGIIDVSFQIQEGEQFYVGKININIEGESPHTKKKVILDRLSFRTGDLIDTREVSLSERRIRRSQLFEHQPAQGISPKITFQSPSMRNAELARRPKSNRRPSRDPGSRYQPPSYRR